MSGPHSCPSTPLDLSASLRERLLADRRTAVLGHFGVLLLIGGLILSDQLNPWLFTWLSVVALSIAARVLWLRHLQTPGARPDRFLGQTRLIMACQGLSWGVGSLFLFPILPPDHFGILLIAFAGLAGAGLSTMAADPRTYRLFVGGLFGPALAGLLLLGPTREVMFTSALVVFYVWISIKLHGRGYVALVEHLDTVGRLSHSEAAQARESAYLASLLQSAPTAIAVVDDSKRVRMVNPKFCELFGYAEADVLDQPLDRLLIPESGMKLHRAITGRATERETIHVEVERRASNGRLIPVRMSTARLPASVDHGWVVLYEDVTEEKRAREEIRAAHETLRTLIESAPVMVATLDRAARVQSWNPAAERMFGWKAEEVIGRFVPTIPPEMQSRFEEVHRATLAGSGVTDLQVPALRRDGSVIDVSVSTAPIRDAGGEITSSIAVLLDISEQKRAQKALERSEAQFRRVAESNIMGICFWNLDGSIPEANDEFLRLTGYDRADLDAGLVNWRVASPPEYMARSEEALGLAMSGQTCVPWEMELLRKDGTRTPILVGLAPLTDAPHFGVAMVLDITGRRRAEEQLRWKTALLEAQVQASIDGILVVDKGDRVIVANQRLAEIWKIPPHISADTDDRKQLEFVVGRTRHPAAFLAKVEHLYAHPDETSRDEIELVNGNTLDRYSAPVVGKGGEYYGRIWTFRDVTEQKQAELAMRNARDQAQQMAQSRAMFLANMSHEIRTPMNAVLGMTELVLDGKLEPDQRHSLEMVYDSAQGLLGIINDVLDYSKIEADHLEIEAIPFQMARLLQASSNTFALAAGKKGVELILDVGADVPADLRGDPSRLRQVITNLVSNAIKFTERGEVVIRVELKSRSAEEAVIRFAVRDSGVGIPADKLGLIFQEFTQADGSTSRRYGGTGLGLAIAQRLVQLMGGEITVTSEVGRGSEFQFTITLPVEKSPELRQPNAVAPLAGKRVLLVDDNSTNRRVFKDLLAAEGMRVTEAESSESAMLTLQQAGSEREPFSLLVVDVRMPVKDGFELVAEVRADPEFGRVPVLMMTSAGRRGDGARCRELGINGYLTKPLSRSDLIESVITVLAGPLHHDDASTVTRHSLKESRRSLRILLAEDVPVNQMVAATMLRKRGHTVEVANNGREAVAAFAREPYELILMDIQMPEMDGFEATEAIRKLPGGTTIPIVALTAHAMAGERERCLARGMSGYLTKPFTAHQLYAAVESWAGPPTQPAATEEAGKPAEPVVALDRLRAELRDAGAEEALDGIVATFLQSVPERVEVLSQALASGSAEDVARAAHALKSPAGAIGAGPLAALLGEIEAAGRSNTLRNRDWLSRQVQAESDAVLAGLRDSRAAAA